MATATSHQYIGSALYQLISASSENLKIMPFPTISNNTFVINDEVVVYIKYSQKTISPWNFTFKKVNQEEIDVIKDMYKKIYIVLVCAKDGIVAFPYNDLKFLLDDNFEDAEWIRLSRVGAKRYTVTGKDGVLPYKLTNKSFPANILSIIKNP